MFDLGRSLIATVERSPQRLAVTDGEQRLTYAQWFAIVQNMAHGLEKLGVKHGDRLLVVMQNRWQMATLHWACQCLGVIVTPLNWRSKAEEIAYRIDDAEVRALAYDESVADAMAACEAASRLPRIVTEDVDAAGATAPNAPRRWLTWRRISIAMGKPPSGSCPCITPWGYARCC